MARRIYSEDLVLNLIINGKDMPAQNKVALKELYKLDRQTRDLEIDLAKVEVAQRKLGARTAKNAAEFDKLAKAAQSLKIQIGQNNATMNKLRQEIGLTGLTINQLNSYLKTLKIQLNNATDPRVMARLRKEIILTENRIKHMVTGASRLSIAFERLGNVANKFGTVTSWIAIVAYAFSRAVGGTINTLRTLDKTFSNVMKTTGLTRQELWALKNQFDQLNLDETMRTPTATKDLLEIARIAGRLGVRGVQNIADFTMAVDKLYVALGEDLQGSVEEVAEKVGKLVTTFRLTDELPLGEAMLRAGSLINELSKSSAAGAVTILNYTSRLGGVGSMAKFSMDQLAGMGAALDAVGVPAERGSTALAKLITGMGEHAEEFARSLGMSTEEYRNAMETNINDTMLKLIQSSATGNASIMDVVAGMDQMDVSGVRVMEVYGKLVQNMDLVIQQQAIARAAFSSSASVMNEFYIMSKDFNSLMAIQGKRWKALSDDYAKAVAPSVYKVYRVFTDLAYAMRDVVRWIGRHINLLWSLIAVWTAFKGVRIAEMIRQIGVNLLVMFVNLKHTIGEIIKHNVIVVAMQNAYVTAGRGIAGFSAALKALWVVVKANPLGLIITAASLVASAFFLFRKRTDELNGVLVKFNAEAGNEVALMGELFERVKNTAIGTEERKEAITRLNTVYGQYLPRLLTEKNSIDEVESAQKKANAALWESIALRVKETEIADINQKMYDKTKKGIKDILDNSVRINALKATRGYDPQLIASVQGQAEAELMILMRQMQAGGGMNPAMVEKFIKDWGVKGGSGNFFKASAVQQVAEVFDIFRQGKQQIDAANTQLDSYITTLGKVTGKTSKENAAGFSILSEAELEDAKKRIDVAASMRENELLQQQAAQNKSDDWFKSEQLKSEEQKIRDLIKLEEDKWTKIVTVEKDGVVEQQRVLMDGLQSSGEYVDLQNQLLRNLQDQKKPAGGGGLKTKQELDDKKAKEAIEKAEADHNLKLVEIKRKYLEGQYLSEDEYNDKILEQEIVFLGEKLKIYKGGSIEYAQAYNDLLEKKVQIEGNINDRILAVQKQFAKIKTDRHISEVDASLALEEERWAEEKAALESQLVVKAELSEKEIQLNELYNKIIEAKEREHQEKLRRINLEPEQERVNSLEKTIEFMREGEGDATFTNNDHLKVILEERLKIIEQIYAKEKKLAGDNLKAKNDADRKYTEANLQLKVDMFDAEQKMQIARINMIQSYLGALRDNVDEESKLGKRLYLLSQALAIASIWIKVASDNAKITSTAMAMFATLGPIAGPAAAIAWSAPIKAANNLNAALNTGLILAQTIGTVAQWEKGSYPIEKLRQFAGGTLPVRGADDGKIYDARYVGAVRTGIYKKPSLGLFAERPEMVIDHPTLKNIQMNSPQLIDAILAYRVIRGTKQSQDQERGYKQYDKGNYIPKDDFRTTRDDELKKLIRKNIEVNERLMKWKPKVVTELIKRDLEILDNISKNRKM